MRLNTVLAAVPATNHRKTREEGSLDRQIDPRARPRKIRTTIDGCSTAAHPLTCSRMYIISLSLIINDQSIHLNPTHSR
jgi:hypothetical protein